LDGHLDPLQLFRALGSLVTSIRDHGARSASSPPGFRIDQPNLLSNVTVVQQPLALADSQAIAPADHMSMETASSLISGGLLNRGDGLAAKVAPEDKSVAKDVEKYVPKAKAKTKAKSAPKVKSAMKPKGVAKDAEKSAMKAKGVAKDVEKYVPKAKAKSAPKAKAKSAPKEKAKSAPKEKSAPQQKPHYAAVARGVKPAAWLKKKPDGCSKCRWTPGCSLSCWKIRGGPP
jgi:hypothetical protein